MESLICENLILLQNGAGFGFKAWIGPLILLLVSWARLILIWLAPERIPKTNSPKRIWLAPLLGSIFFVWAGYLTLQDRAMNAQALETGNYATITGRISEIETHANRRSSGVMVDTIEFRIIGTIQFSSGEIRELTGGNQFSAVHTEKNMWFTGGKSCPGRKCGLKPNDQIRIKVNDMNTGIIRDTLSIEKCQAS